MSIRDKLKPKERIVSKDTIEPSEKTCNGKLASRDGYCQSPGVINFHRCKLHGGRKTTNALDLFKAAVPVDVASKLQTLVEDSLSMDGELASGKAMLLETLEDYHRCSYVVKSFQETIPERPGPDASESEIETYNSAVTLHLEMINDARKSQQMAWKQAHAMIRTLSTAVHRNNKIKEGAKFQLDAKQVASILKIQLQVMRMHCAKCPNLKNVLKGIREGTQDIPLETNLTQSTRETLGRRKYKEMVKNAEDLADIYQPDDADIVDE